MFFSRFLRVKSLRSKGTEAVEAAFVKMCSKKNKLNFPMKLWLDQRKEFFEDMANYCEDVGVKYYHTYSETEVAFDERAIRTLKNLIYSKKTTHYPTSKTCKCSLTSLTLEKTEVLGWRPEM